MLQYVIISYRKTGKYLYSRSNNLKELEGMYIADTDLQSDSYKEVFRNEQSRQHLGKELSTEQGKCQNHLGLTEGEGRLCQFCLTIPAAVRLTDESHAASRCYLLSFPCC